MEEKMRISKQLMNGALGIFNKHFPDEKNTPLKDKKKIVRFFIYLNELCTKNNIQLTKKHIEYLSK